MILDRNGKLFGKISIVDLGIILAVIVIAFGAANRFSGAGKISTETTRVKFVVKVENVRQYTIDALEKKGIVTDSKSGARIGEITDIRVENAEFVAMDAKGNLVNTQVPEKYTAFVTVEGEFKKGEEGYITADTQGLFIDHDYNLVTKYVSTTGVVQSIEEIGKE
ncbi:MAG: DUF4330 domain-containing protein [Clostridia bacterium]|nr:DUF4330 domain-containing protein [Clostridia bacterium]